MLILSALFVLGCAFRSFLPRAEGQRICLYDSWWSSAILSRSVATVAELAQLGVRRISVGGGLARVAWTGFLQAATEIAEHGTFAGLGRAASFADINKSFGSK